MNLDIRVVILISSSYDTFCSLISKFSSPLWNILTFIIIPFQFPKMHVKIEGITKSFESSIVILSQLADVKSWYLDCIVNFKLNGYGNSII